MNDYELEQIMKRLANANENWLLDKHKWTMVIGVGDQYAFSIQHAGDADMIVNARRDLDACVTEIRRLRKTLEAVRSIVVVEPITP